MLRGRKSLTDSIINILSDGVPRKATTIVKILAQNGHRGVERREVNSILYNDLKGTFLEVDAGFRWTLKHSTDTEGLAEVPADDLPLSEARARRAANIRTVHRLRCGLPPFECIEELTVGQDRSKVALLKWLRGEADIPRWMLVEGDYGQGKSHSLALVRELAHNEGLATCYLCADGSGSALNHPQRFLPNLLSTLEIPSQPGATYTKLLADILTDPANVEFIIGQVRAHLPSGRQVPTYINWSLNKLKSLASDSQADSAEIRERVSYLAAALGGEFIRQDPASPRSRQIAYMLLHVARDVIQKFWARGLVLMVDEAESVFTKLRDPRSRLGAFRVLAALCHSRKLRDCPVVIAITPDAAKEMVAAVPDMARDTGNLPSEPVRPWSATLTDGTVVKLRCRPLRREERLTLTERVRTLYMEAYPDTISPQHDEAAWHEFSTALAGTDAPPRLLVRNVVDFLDGLRYSSLVR